MKTLKVPFLANLHNMDHAALSEAMEFGAARQYIDSENWPREFPYAPVAVFDIARSENHLFIRFFVRGAGARAVNTGPNTPVWEDSCVEFFMQEAGAQEYMNFEFNCIGTCLAARRRSKTDADHLAPEQIGRIIRHASLGSQPFGERDGIIGWELTAGIPFDLMGLDPAALPRTLRANFYKCGDKTRHPHFLSWNPIDTPSPNFHCPEFFGELQL